MAGGGRWRLNAIVSLIALVLIGAACSSTTTPAVEDMAVGADIDWANVAATFDEWGPTAEGGGVAFVRLADGTSESFATGGDAVSGEPLDAQDRVRVGSISKVFTLVMMMQLVDEGSVELDALVSDYLGDLRMGTGVTVRQLLAHRSGIPNYTDAAGFVAIMVEGPDRSPSPTDMLDLVVGEPDFEPGARFAYSNSNYIVLGLLIEALDQRSLGESLAARIATPLDLTMTGFDDGDFTDVAAGYSSVVPGGTSASRSYRSIALGAWAAGGMVTTVDELATFLDALFFDDLVSAESLEAMTAGLDDDADYGLGLHTGPDFGIGHGGSIIGFNSIAEIDPDTGAMIIVVVNNDLRDPAIASRVLWESIRGS